MMFCIEYKVYTCPRFGGITFRRVYMFGDIDSVIRRFKSIYADLYVKCEILNIEAVD